MKIACLMRILALSAGVAACWPATAGARWDWGGDRPGLRSAERQELAYLDPEQRRQMRQQMREQWRESPPRQGEWRQDLRDPPRERSQPLPPDDRFRIREDLREQHGGGRWRGFGGRR